MAYGVVRGWWLKCCLPLKIYLSLIGKVVIQKQTKLLLYIRDICGFMKCTQIDQDGSITVTLIVLEFFTTTMILIIVKLFVYGIINFVVITLYILILYCSTLMR